MDSSNQPLDVFRSTVVEIEDDPVEIALSGMTICSSLFSVLTLGAFYLYRTFTKRPIRIIRRNGTNTND
jgi:hypothetical protein